MIFRTKSIGIKTSKPYSFFPNSTLPSLHRFVVWHLSCLKKPLLVGPTDLCRYLFAARFDRCRFSLSLWEYILEHLHGLVCRPSLSDRVSTS
jgi:hypothetical protein